MIRDPPTYIGSRSHITEKEGAMNYRYKLDDRPGKRKINCPNPACPDHKRSGAKTFTRYYDTQTGEFVADEVGRCDHEVRCRYHLTPSEYFDRYPMLKNHPKPGSSSLIANNSSLIATHSAAGGSSLTTLHSPLATDPSPLATDPSPLATHHSLLIPHHSLLYPFFEKSLSHHLKNNLYLFLCHKLTGEVADRVAARYYLGTSKYLPGVPVFWYIDSEFNVTTGKIMYYPDPVKGKRYRESDRYHGKPVVNFVHAVLKIPGFKRKPCFFGEHLLTLEPGKPVMVVESEKTALIASAFYPDHVVLATGGMNGLQNLDWSLTRGREVVLIPDTSTGDVATKNWTEQAKQINARYGLGVKISCKLDALATEAQKSEGWDLGDYLLRNVKCEM